MESASVPVKGAEKATPLSKPDAAFVFARAFCNYEAWLHLTHRLPGSYAIADLEDNIRAYAEHLQHSGPSNARHMLEQFETDSGFPTPDALFRLLEPVVSAWDQSLTCKIVPNELEEHRSFCLLLLPRMNLHVILSSMGQPLSARKWLRIWQPDGFRRSRFGS